MVNHFDLKKAAEIFKKKYCRNYNLYFVGFIKNRKRIEKFFRDKKKAKLLFKSYQKKKYKSAYYFVSEPIPKSLKRMEKYGNPILKKLAKTNYFCGKNLICPVLFKEDK